MPNPKLLTLNSELEYRRAYQACFKPPIVTFDGITVRPGDFNHIFYKDHQGSGRRQDFVFNRAERIPMIAEVLQDANASLFFGWERKRGVLYNRRTALVHQEFAVVIQFQTQTLAKVVTVYCVEQYGLANLLASEPWSTSKLSL